ncbi:MAG TPA: T9SS type A sorting domain-containing protein [Candidatus Didemnitutus sp.]|nr:T9SS type A sorting domain-containing protein [Candidatus Didemnitutus sp.]
MKIGMEVGAVVCSTMVRGLYHIVGILFCAAISAGAQGSVFAPPSLISGEINSHEAIAEIFPCDSTVRMRQPTQFRVGEEVLMIQMKGARIIETDDSTYGTITDMNGAGCAEFLVIGAITNDRITFTSTWVHPYDPAGSIQLVSVPTLGDAVTTGTVTAKSWNGTVGGVVVLRVVGTLSLVNNIDVSGLGFRGGFPSFPVDVCTPDEWGSYFIFGGGGEKGDGIGTIGSNQALASRGPFANGGGGGNGGNAGGAGGSNAGNGGHGGDANTFCPVFKGQGGYPGQAVDSLLLKQRVFMGGGGGGGHQNNIQGTAGAPGGGIVIIKANSITSSGGQILARGNRVADTAAWNDPIYMQPGDGAGGGGAGGTVLLDVTAGSSAFTVDVQGGDGGYVGARYQPNGPGGGGGGGAVILTNPLPQLNAIVNGGKPGTHTSPETADSVRNSSWGATGGTDGRVVVGFAWKFPSRKAFTASGGGDICPGDSVTLTAMPGFMLYRWSNGRTEPTIRVGDAGIYSVTVTDSGGCRQTVGGMVVKLDPTLIDIPATLDFGSVDFKRSYRRVLTIRSLDDDTIVVTGVSNTTGFTVVDPTIFPATIAPFGNLDVEIEFVANEPREYFGTINVDVAEPCALARTVDLHAKVNPVRLHVFMPDTVAKMGEMNMSVPIYATLMPDTVSLPNSLMRIRVAVNSRMFAPTGVTRGRIVGDVIDMINDVRTVDIEIDSITIPALTSVLTRVVGSVLLSGEEKSVLDVIGVEWIRSEQTPILTMDDGSLTVDPVCFANGRMITILKFTPLAVWPNPASDILNVSTTLHAQGAYRITITDILGRTLASYSETVASVGQSRPLTLTFPVASWEQGTYSVQLVSPLGTEVASVVIRH